MLDPLFSECAPSEQEPNQAGRRSNQNAKVGKSPVPKIVEAEKDGMIHYVKQDPASQRAAQESEEWHPALFGPSSEHNGHGQTKHQKAEQRCRKSEGRAIDSDY
jgi:hypothetical protein